MENFTRTSIIVNLQECHSNIIFDERQSETIYYISKYDVSTLLNNFINLPPELNNIDLSNLRIIETIKYLNRREEKTFIAQLSVSLKTYETPLINYKIHQYIILELPDDFDINTLMYDRIDKRIYVKYKYDYVFSILHNLTDNIYEVVLDEAGNAFNIKTLFLMLEEVV